MRRPYNYMRSIHRPLTDNDAARIATFSGPKTILDLVGMTSDERRPPRHRRNPFVRG